VPSGSLVFTQNRLPQEEEIVKSKGGEEGEPNAKTTTQS